MAMLLKAPTGDAECLCVHICAFPVAAVKDRAVTLWSNSLPERPTSFSAQHGGQRLLKKKRVRRKMTQVHVHEDILIVKPAANV